MKCDVCLTKIPKGSNVCPNCGYIVGKSHVNTFDLSSQTHEHIQTKTQNRQAKIKPSLSKKNYAKTKKQPSKNIFKPVMIIAVIIAFLGSVGIPLLSSIFNFSSLGENRFDDMTFQEIIDNDYDEYNTVTNALKYEKEIIQYLEKNNFEEIRTHEYCYQYDNNSLEANLTVSSYKNNICYDVLISYKEGNMNHHSLTISGRFDSYIDRTVFQIKEDDVKDIANYLKIDNVYQTWKDCHAHMVEENENEFEYSHYGDVEVYMHETYSDTKPHYNFYYSIGD